MSRVSIISSDRIDLFEIESTDFAFIKKLMTAPAVVKYTTGPKTNEQVWNKINTSLYSYREGKGLGTWIAYTKVTNDPIGWGTLNHLEGSKYIQLGYRFLPEYWGQGYATELGKTLLDYGLDTLMLDKVVAVTHVDNTASQRVLEKLSFEYKGLQFYYKEDVRFHEKHK